MTLENYVKFERDVEKVLKFVNESFRIEPREIIDTETKKERKVNAAVVEVREEDGQPVTKTLSTLSEKFASALNAAHGNGTLYRYKIGITKKGERFGTEYTLRFF